MQKNLKYEAAGVSKARPSETRILKMDYEGVLTSERMKEIMMMCDRQKPLYEEVSSFTTALYALGVTAAPDFMSFQDISASQAASILNADFVEVPFEEIPKDYHIAESRERYLLVVGDPIFPAHFAVVADMAGSRPYFSKLPFFGAGYDSLEELMDEFAGIDGIKREDVRFFRKTWYGQIPPASVGKIYIVKN